MIGILFPVPIVCDLSFSHRRLAGMAINSKDTEEAILHLSPGRSKMAGLTAKLPDWAEWRNDLARFDGLLAALK